MGTVVSIKKEKDTDFTHRLEKPLSLSVSKKRKAKTGLLRALNFIHDKTVRRAWEWYCRVESTRLVGEFMTLAMRLNRENFQVEIKYFGTLSKLYCFVHLGGRKDGKEPARLIVGANHDQIYKGGMSPKNLRKAMRDLIVLSKHSDMLCPRYF